jgi:MSHA biogenesis protein MshP
MRRQTGFSLVFAIFFLVVVGLLGSYMVFISGVQKETVNFAILNARAYQAARAGIEWSIATITNGGTCTQVIANNPMNFTGLSTFPVTLSCSSSAYSEGGNSGYIYAISSLSQYDTYTANDYIARQINISILH